MQDFLSSGMTSDEAGQLWDTPEHSRLYDYLGSISQPLRLTDLIGHIRSESLPEFPPPTAAGPIVSFLASPLLHRDQRVGKIFLAAKEHGYSVPDRWRCDHHLHWGGSEMPRDRESLNCWVSFIVISAASWAKVVEPTPILVLTALVFDLIDQERQSRARTPSTP